MDPTMIAEQPTGFVGWIMANGQVVAFVAQILYWFAMIVLLAYAVWQYKRWVNYTLGVGRSGKLRTGEDAEPKAGEKVSVEEFVE